MTISKTLASLALLTASTIALAPAAIGPAAAASKCRPAAMAGKCAGKCAPRKKHRKVHKKMHMKCAAKCAPKCGARQ